MESKPQEGISRVLVTKERFVYLKKKIVQYYRLKQLDIVNKEKPVTQYKPGNVLYLISSHPFLPKTSSGKFRVIYIGPVVVYKILDKFQYISTTLQGKN